MLEERISETFCKIQKRVSEISPLCWKAVHRPGLMSDHSKLKRQCVWVPWMKFGYAAVCLGLMFPSVMWQSWNHLALHSCVQYRSWKTEEKTELEFLRSLKVLQWQLLQGDWGKRKLQPRYLDTCFGIWLITPCLFFYSPGECSNYRIPAYTQLFAKEILPSKIEKRSN